MNRVENYGYIFSLLLIPFAYSSVWGVRVLIFQFLLTSLVATSSAFRRSSIHIDRSLLVVPWMLAFLLAFSTFTSDFSVLTAFFIFIVLAYWWVAFDVKALEFILPKSLFAYVFGAFFCAGGVFLQFLANKFFDIKFARIELFGGGRTAYSFLWQDFSFLSLYLVSAVPIVYDIFSSKWKSILVLALVLSSIITSARTGIVALIAFAVVFSFIYTGRCLVSMRANPKVIALGAGIALLLLCTPFALTSFTGRELTVSSSGRMEGFYASFVFFLEHIYMGAMFNIDFFVDEVSVIPHNIFIYFLVMGGSLFFVVFFIWLALVASCLFSFRSSVFAALCIVFVGFQFIPSFFSAYFVASLIGIGMAQAKIESINSRFSAG